MSQGQHAEPLQLYTGERWISVTEALSVLTALRLAMAEMDGHDVKLVQLRCERTARVAEEDLIRRRDLSDRAGT